MTPCLRVIGLPWPTLGPWTNPRTDSPNQIGHQHIKTLAMNVQSREILDENLRYCSDGYVTKSVSLGMYRWQARVWGIGPVVVDRTQKFTCGIIVEPSPALTSDWERRIQLWHAFHEPMDDQDFQLVDILIVSTVCFFPDLTLHDQPWWSRIRGSTYLLESILELCDRDLTNRGYPL